MAIFSKRFLFMTVLCCVTTLFSLTAAESKKPVNWQRYTSENNCFSIDLPQKPEHLHQTITVPNSDLKINYDTFISEPSDKVVFVVSVWHYPKEIDLSQPEVNLQDGFGGMLSALPDAEVMDIDMNDLEGNKSLGFLVKNEDIYFQGRLVLVNNVLYQIFTVYKDDFDMKEFYSHFIDSFRLYECGEKEKEAGKNTEGKVLKMSV